MNCSQVYMPEAEHADHKYRQILHAQAPATAAILWSSRASTPVESRWMGSMDLM